MKIQMNLKRDEENTSFLSFKEQKYLKIIVDVDTCE